MYHTVAFFPSETNRAKLTLAFCPPLRALPRSPTNDMSPFWNISKSRLRAHASITVLYHFNSNGQPYKILSRTLPSKIHGTWLAYAILPLTLILPVINGSSFRRAWRRELWNREIQELIKNHFLYKVHFKIDNVFFMFCFCMYAIEYTFPEPTAPITPKNSFDFNSNEILLSVSPLESSCHEATNRSALIPSDEEPGFRNPFEMLYWRGFASLRSSRSRNSCQLHN